MPIFEFVCNQCQHRFETLVGASFTPECPTCKSADLEKQFSVFGFGNKTAEPAPKLPGASGCQRCGDPHGPCSN